MFRHFLRLISFNHKSEPQNKLSHEKSLSAKVKLGVMFKMVQEFGVYIHRFHSLDLFQQGWYQIKISLRLEDSKYSILGTPARVFNMKDGYAPYCSARIELCQAASWDYSKKGKMFLEMLNSCLDLMRAPSSDQRVFMRCDVHFDTSSYGKNFNSILVGLLISNFWTPTLFQNS